MKKQRDKRFAPLGVLLIGVLIGVAFSYVFYPYVFENRGSVKGQLEDPLEAWSEASYIVWKYNSTFYAARNMSTLLVDYFGTDATQIANNAFSAGDGVVFFKGATYTLSDSIQLDSGDIIMGEGNNTVFSVPTGNNFNAIEALGTAGNRLKDIDIMDIRIIGANDTYLGNPNQQNGIYLNFTDRPYISNVFVEKMGHLGAAIFRSKEPIVSDSIFMYNEYGIEFGIAERGQMVTVKAMYNDLSGILVENGFANVIDGCISAENKEHGLGAEGEARLSIVGGIYENNGVNGIDLRNLQHSTVSGITSRYNGQVGLGHGVKLSLTSTENSITSNTLVANSDHGIIEADTSDYNWIVNNGMWDNVYGSYKNEGSGTHSAVRYNRGYITENGGYTLASNNDWIAHGLVAQPTSIVITVTASDARYIAQVLGANATHFQLYLWDDTAGALETVDKYIYYYVEYHP